MGILRLGVGLRGREGLGSDEEITGLCFRLIVVRERIRDEVVCGMPQFLSRLIRGGPVLLPWSGACEG